MQRPLSRRLIRFANFAFLFVAVLAISSHAGVLQLFGSMVEYIAPIVWPQPPIVQPGTAGGPPSDAIVLFDGKDMSAFKDGEDWKVKDGCAIADKHDIDTKQAFGDCQVHVEWAAPEKVEGRGQGRGNSGVFMMGQYEIQILDSYDNDTYYDGQCAGGLQAASAHGQRLPQAGRVADLRHHLGGPQVRQAGQTPQAGLRDRAAQRRGGAEPLRADWARPPTTKSRTTRPIPPSCRCACSSTATRSASATSGSARSRTSSASPASTRITRGNSLDSRLAPPHNPSITFLRRLVYAIRLAKTVGGLSVVRGRGQLPDSPPIANSCRRPASAGSPTAASITASISEDDPFGWHVTEYEEALELQPGLEMIAKELMHVVQHSAAAIRPTASPEKKLEGNPYWPDDLQTSGAPQHERYVLLLPLALSKTQDDKGRVRWTLFGGSEQGPAKAFWKSFLYRAAAGSAARVVRRIHPPPAGRRLRRKAGSPGRSSQSGLSRLHQSRRRAPALMERRAAAQMDRALPLGKGFAPRRPLPA